MVSPAEEALPPGACHTVPGNTCRTGSSEKEPGTAGCRLPSLAVGVSWLLGVAAQAVLRGARTPTPLHPEDGRAGPLGALLGLPAGPGAARRLVI